MWFEVRMSLDYCYRNGWVEVPDWESLPEPERDDRLIDAVSDWVTQQVEVWVGDPTRTRPPQPETKGPPGSV